MATSCNMIFRIWDVTAAFEAEGTCQNAQKFSRIPRVFEESREGNAYQRFGTLEKDQFLLDGEHSLFPDKPETEMFGLWSKAMSGPDRAFQEPPVFTVNFSGPHSSVGITLHFDQHDNDYCSQVKIRWHKGEALLTEAVFWPDSSIYFCEHHVEGYTKLEILFLQTSKPYRYVKLGQVDFGASLPLMKEDIVSAELLEEVDPISSEISINTLNFTVYSQEEKFCLVNPRGLYQFLQKKQRVDIFQDVDGKILFMGCQYFDTAENQSPRLTAFKCVDMVGIIEQTNFNGGMYKEKRVQELLDEIAESAGAGASFNLHQSFRDATVSGYLPVCTHREALQQIAFAIGAAVDCSRAYEINIFPAPTVKAKDIEYRQKIDNHAVKQCELVTSVAVTAHEYTQNSDVAELFRGELNPGIHEIAFGSPAHSLSAEGAVLLAGCANMASVEVASAGEIVIRGKGYNESTSQFRAALGSMPANERANELTVDSATLINNSNGQETAERVLAYCQNRLEGTGGILLEGEHVSDFVDMQTMSAQTIRGTIERLNINLAGGFLAEATVKGKAV